MSLQEALSDFKKGVVAKLTPEDAALMDQGAEDLIRSGILERAKKKGDVAPDFALPNPSGEMVALSTLLARGPVVVTFYRGVWWPYCNLQLQAYQDILPEIKGLGAAMVAISPQTPEYSLSMAEKHRLGFEVLSDAGNLAARRYGLVFSLGEPLRALYKEKFGIDVQKHNADNSSDLPMPGTFVVAPDGRIHYAFVDPDYTLRLEPEKILQSLKEIAVA